MAFLLVDKFSCQYGLPLFSKSWYCRVSPCVWDGCGGGFSARGFREGRFSRCFWVLLVFSLAFRFGLMSFRYCVATVQLLFSLRGWASPHVGLGLKGDICLPSLALARMIGHYSFEQGVGVCSRNGRPPNSNELFNLPARKEIKDRLT